MSGIAGRPLSSPKQWAWIRSAEFNRHRMIGLRRCWEINARQPKCGAKRRTDGEPCRNIALENGRCKFHGGKTPKGAQWHKIQPPERGAPVEKLEKKQREVAKRHAQQTERIAAMTPEQLEAYRKRQAAVAPGSAAERARRTGNRDAAALLARLLDEKPAEPEMDFFA